MTKTWYSVAIDRAGTSPPSDSEVDRLIDALEARSEVAGVVVSWGGLAGGPGAQVSVQAGDPSEAVTIASEALDKALADAGIAAGEPVFVEVMTEAYQTAWLEQPNRTDYVGLAEIAEILGVSKQRVSELRGREDFPTSIAELRSGPVWTRVSLNHFIEGWARRPGRPRKDKVAAE